MGPVMDVDDPVQKKTDDLLEQLGLHPAQLKAQEHLKGIAAQDSMTPEAPKPAGGDELIDTAPSSTEEATADPSLGSLPAPESMGKDSNLIQAAPELPKPQYKPFDMPSPKVSALPKAMTGDDESSTPSGADHPWEKDYGAAHQELDRLSKTGSGVHQIHNPFLRTLATIGDTAGRMFFPFQEAMIPGTEGHHQMLINTQMGNMDRSLNEGKTRADIGKEEAEADADRNPEDYKESTGFETTQGGPILVGNRGNVKTPTIPNVQPKPILPKGEGEIPLGAQRVEQLNAGLESMWKSNPANAGKGMPDQYRLPPNAVGKDFDRVDKLLEHAEKNTENQTAKAQAQAMREEVAELRREALNNSEAKAGRKMVIGTDRTGEQVAMSEADGEKQGLQDMMEVGQQEQEKVLNARKLLPLFHKDDPDFEKKGIIDIVEDMTPQERDSAASNLGRILSDSKLGPINGRIQEFLRGTVGVGDPKFSALIAKLNLGTTALMNVHVGNRGGAYLLEHFEDAANAKRMDGKSLMAALRAEFSYIRDQKSMLAEEGRKRFELKPTNLFGQHPELDNKGNPNSAAAPEKKVWMLGGDGVSKRQVPASQVQHYKSLKAREMTPEEIQGMR